MPIHLGLVYPLSGMIVRPRCGINSEKPESGQVPRLLDWYRNRAVGPGGLSWFEAIIAKERIEALVKWRSERAIKGKFRGAGKLKTESESPRSVSVAS